MAILEQFLIDLLTQICVALLENLPAVSAGIHAANQTTIATAPLLPQVTTDAINLELSHAILTGDVPAPGVVIHP